MSSKYFVTNTELHKRYVNVYIHVNIISITYILLLFQNTENTEFDQVAINFNQGDDRTSILCQKTEGWKTTDSLFSIIKYLHDIDGVTVLDCDPVIAKKVSEGDAELYFVMESTVTIPFSAIKSEKGKKEYTLGSIWKLTGMKANTNIQVLYKEKRKIVRTNLF